MIRERTVGETSTHFCGLDHDHDRHGMGFDDAMARLGVRDGQNASKDDARGRRAGAGGDPAKNTCTMALVSDHRFFGHYGSFSETANVMIGMLEGASQLYKVIHAPLHKAMTVSVSPI
jgi:hypothetical protein